MSDNTLMWKSHVEIIIPKLTVACAVVRAIETFVMLIKIFYHFYFHSIINCGIIFWGNSSYSNSIFALQKRIILMIVGVGIGALCTEFF